MGVTFRTAKVASGVGRHGENRVGGGINRLPVPNGGNVWLSDFTKYVGFQQIWRRWGISKCGERYRRDGRIGDIILQWICIAVDLRLTDPIGAPRFWPSRWDYVCALSCSGYVVRLMAQASLATRVFDTRPNTLDHRTWHQSFWVGARKCIPVSEDP
jgi:hypothetical protein